MSRPVPELPSSLRGNATGRFKCTCKNPDCDLEAQLQKKADILGISLGSTALLLNTLKNTMGATPIPMLKELAGGLLNVVSLIQDKREVKGGFNHIIVDCLRVACIVCDHTKRRQNHISQVIHNAIEQLYHDLGQIKDYAGKMNKRGVFQRTIMGTMDKAEVGAWRQRLTTSWTVFMTELLMDTNYKVTPTNAEGPLDQAEIVKQIVERLAAKQGGQINHEITDYAAPPYEQSNEDSRRIQRPQGDYQRPRNEPQPNSYSNGNSYTPQGSEDPGSYYDGGETPQSYTSKQQYPRDDSRNPFRSQTAWPNRPSHWPPAPPSHVHSDAWARDANHYGWGPQGYYPQAQGPYGHHDPGYGSWGSPPPPPPPHRYRTMPPQSAPVNNIGSVANANFGENYGTITQTSGSGW